MADVLGFMRKAFPFIAAGASLGGPLGSLAANAVGMALGVKVEPTVDGVSSAVAEAIQKDPQAAVALQKAENDFKVQMAQMQIQSVTDLETLAEKDRESARGREVALKDWTPKALCFLVVLLCFGGEGLYFFRGAPANAAPELIGRILGTLDSALILVLGYYFGSSAGSADKTDALTSIAKQK